MSKPRIESDQLNEIYKKWIVQHGKDYNTWSDHIDNASFRYGLGKSFDEYVWTNGGRIAKEHGRRYAEFFEDTDMIMFALKHL